jgi:hypothetical protein
MPTVIALGTPFAKVTVKATLLGVDTRSPVKTILSLTCPEMICGGW